MGASIGVIELFLYGVVEEDFSQMRLASIMYYSFSPSVECCSVLTLRNSVRFKAATLVLSGAS